MLFPDHITALKAAVTACPGLDRAIILQGIRMNWRFASEQAGSEFKSSSVVIRQTLCHQ